MDIPEILKPLLDRPVAILGDGVSGRAAADLLRSQGRWFEIYDERGGMHTREDFTPRDAARHGLVIISPGFAPEHPWQKIAREAGCTVMGELDFASLFWVGGSIAVTGTNGKTTVTEFIAYALKRAGQKAIAVGNVGYPMSRLFELSNHEGALAVCEVSSYQAESLEHYRPQALIWTNFDEDHLDRYPSMEAYFNAKWRLVEQLSRPCLIVGESVAFWAKKLGKELPSYAIVVKRGDAEGAPPSRSPFVNFPQQENYRLVRAFWQKEGRSLNNLDLAARMFTPPKHRLQLVAQMGNAAFWNDSKATNFASALAALKVFKDPVYWIGGGKSKGGDVDLFADAVAGTVKEAFLIGETAPQLAERFRRGKVDSHVCQSLPEAVNMAYSRVKQPGVVLLSPGFSSHDMFESYTQRGFAFEQAVLSLKKQSTPDSPSSCEPKPRNLS